jgi:small-conductance mechanosensitive channel
LEIDGNVVLIESIGLSTSKAMNRNAISVIILNSLITTSKVINWTYQSHQTRFKIHIGLAYLSDVDLVIKIEARLLGFGVSSLDFQLLFFRATIFRIGKIKSDIRRIINKNVIENNIVIAFPQMDLHVKSTSNDKLQE